MTVNYRDTLNLPDTEFSMKAGLPRKEPEILEMWSKKDLYGKIRKKYEDKELFLLHDGPPYANGDIHLGHSVNKILKDITIKYKTLKGFNAPYIPGWDCHGLPIELNVEKKHGKNKIGRRVKRKPALAEMGDCRNALPGSRTTWQTLPVMNDVFVFLHALTPKKQTKPRYRK